MLLDRLIIYSIKLFNYFDWTDLTGAIYNLWAHEEKAFIELFTIFIGVEKNWG